MDPITAQLSAIVPAARSLEELTRPLLEILSSTTGMESTYLTSIDLRADLQHVLYARNAEQGFVIPEGLSVPWEDTLCKRALDDQCPHTDDVAGRWGDSDAARSLGIRSYLSAPIRTSGGEVLGTLCAASPARRPLSAEAHGVLRLFSALVGQIMEREKLVEQLAASNAQLARHATTDPLTGLPNRRALASELQRLLARGAREGSCVLVGVIDLDGFKSINDCHGHDVGDAFLQHTAQRLATALRASDMLGRLGGDEFVVLGPGPAVLNQDAGRPLGPSSGPMTIPAARTAAAKLQQRCAHATVGAFVHLNVALEYAGASVGVVAIDPRTTDAEQALKYADSAMYEVKHGRRLGQAA